MRRLVNRQVAGVLLMSLLLVLAGCSGGGNGTATNTTQNNSSSSASGGATVSGEIGLGTYEFSEGESYTYNVTFLGSPFQSRWHVVSVDNETVTVEGTQITEGETQNTTITGNQSSILPQASQDSVTSVFPTARRALALQDIVTNASAGDTLQLTENNLANPDNVDWSEATLEINGTKTVNGIDCTEATLTPDGGSATSACINGDYPFPLTLTAMQDGDPVLTMELVNATQP